ncbi:MAG TPA: hypothetical protein ENN07_08135 [candidate division Zixibacteria bacterium]|nr:hypothetical protein [candidate division Zixibacteria bacterium]
MAKSKRTVKIYWLQFVLAAVWVGVADVLIRKHVSGELRSFILDILIVLTGILAFEPVGRHIFKYLLISIGASLLIQGLRRVGEWYMSAGPSFWHVGGPLIALAGITILVYIIGAITHKDQMRL